MSPEDVEDVGQRKEPLQEQISAPSRLSITLALLSMGLALLSLYGFICHPPAFKVLNLYVDLKLLDPTMGAALSVTLLLLAVVSKKLAGRPPRGGEKEANNKVENLVSEDLKPILDSIKSSLEELKSLYGSISSSLEELRKSIKEAAEKFPTPIVSKSRSQAEEDVFKEVVEPVANEEATQNTSLSPSFTPSLIEDKNMPLDALLIVSSLDSLKKTVETLHRRAAGNK